MKSLGHLVVHLLLKSESQSARLFVSPGMCCASMCILSHHHLCDCLIHARQLGAFSPSPSCRRGIRLDDELASGCDEFPESLCRQSTCQCLLMCDMQPCLAGCPSLSTCVDLFALQLQVCTPALIACVGRNHIVQSGSCSEHPRCWVLHRL